MMFGDLMAQAKHLAAMESKRPKMASLRRAISGVYYALFHYLVHHSTCEIMGTQSAESPYRHVLARGFEHKTMKEACKSFSLRRIEKERFKELDLNGYPVPVEIQDLANTFAELQDMRHRADYNLNRKWTRSEVLAAIDQAERAVQTFEKLKLKDPHRSFFLGNLIAWSKY